MKQQRPSMIVAALLALACGAAVAATDQPGRPMSPSEARVAFASADLDRDGAISIDEFHKDVLRSWHALDHDRDGYVSVAEMLAVVRNDREVASRLRMADRDGDGRLSFKEVVEARMAFFAAADANKDDKLSLREVLDYLATLKTPRRP